MKFQIDVFHFCRVKDKPNLHYPLNSDQTVYDIYIQIKGTLSTVNQAIKLISQ